MKYKLYRWRLWDILIVFEKDIPVEIYEFDSGKWILQKLSDWYDPYRSSHFPMSNTFIYKADLTEEEAFIALL